MKMAKSGVQNGRAPCRALVATNSRRRPVDDERIGRDQKSPKFGTVQNSLLVAAVATTDFQFLLNSAGEAPPADSPPVTTDPLSTATRRQRNAVIYRAGSAGGVPAGQTPSPPAGSGWAALPHGEGHGTAASGPRLNIISTSTAEPLARHSSAVARARCCMGVEAGSCWMHSAAPFWRRSRSHARRASAAMALCFLGRQAPVAMFAA